jgi:tetratricopeptide (TPR) repeat protein
MKVVNVNIQDVLILFKQKNYVEAKRVFLEIIKNQQVEPRIYYIIYQIFQNLNELHEAEKYLIKFIEHDKKNHVACNNLANLYLKKKELKKAELSYLKAIDLKKDYLTAIVNIALYYEGIGNIAYAKEYYSKGIKISPKNLSIYFNLSKIDKRFISEEKIEFIEEVLKNHKLDELNTACGYFLLAKNEERKKRYDKEIDYLIIAHKHAFNNRKDFNALSTNYWLNFIPKNYNKFKYVSKNKYEKKMVNLNPIFIIGLPRSGSTIVESMISSGTEKVLNLGETNLVNWSLINTHQETLFNKKNNDLLIETSIFEKRLFSSLKNFNNFNSETKTFTEKSLENFFYIDLILKIFPNAKFIHTHRNTEDNIVAIFKSFLTNVSWTHSLEDIFIYVNHYLTIIDSYERKYPQKILSVPLEELTEKGEIISKKIYKFCSLEWSYKVLEFYKRKDLFSNTASNVQIRDKLQKYDYEKYKPYKVFLKKFSDKYKKINDA